MKKFLLLLLPVLLLCFTAKKTFKKQTSTISIYSDSIKKPIVVVSKDFFISKINEKNIDLTPSTDTIFLNDKKGEKIGEYQIDLEGYDNDTSVFEITNHHLKNVNKILTFTIEECTCGCYITNVYVIQTLDNRYIELPSISFSSNESVDPSYEYQFGKLNTIYYLEKIDNFAEIGTAIITKKIERQKKLIWDGEKIISNKVITQKKYIVTAKNGLTMRDKPGLEGKKIGSLPFMTETTIQYKTENTLDLKDEGKTIKGNWVKIENNFPDTWSVGYVFDGFLVEKTIFNRISTKILFPDCYQDDYKEDLEGLNSKWFHLYRRNANYYLENPIFTKKRSYNECTGDSLTCLSSSKETLLFIKRPSLKRATSKVETASIPEDVIWSGEAYSFSFKNQNYTLKATGNFYNNDDRSKKEYTLNLQSAGKSEIMFVQNIFEDTVPKIIFIGDLDNDNKPDFIIDSPTNYEEHRKILFLSTDAIDGKLIEKTAEMSVDFAC